MTDADPAGGTWHDPVVEALERSSALVAVGRAGEAEAVVRRALAGEPDDADLRTELARVLVVDHRADEAVEHADRAVAAAPEDPHAHLVRALALTELPRRGTDAVAAARRAVELEPEAPSAYRVLARAHLRATRLGDAQTAVEHAIRLDPADADGHALLGIVLLDRSRPVEAEVALREALRLDPADADARNNLGVALQAQGTDRGPEAREAFEAAARAQPQDAVARQNLATDARTWVNGRWAWGLVVLGTVQAAVRLPGDGTDRAGGVAWLVVAAGLAAYLLVRGRRRRAALSPAAQRLLEAQGWRERTQALSYRPWFWFVPAPVWTAIATVLVLVWGGGLLVGAGEADGATAVALGIALVVLVLTGRRTWQRLGAPRWRRRRG